MGEQPYSKTLVHLTFSRKQVESLLRHTLASTDRSPSWSERGETEISAGLWLVSNHGIYLMSNGRNAEGKHGKTAHPVAYAHECNPDTLPFDHWWDVKNAAFRGGDFSVVIPASTAKLWLAGTFQDPVLLANGDGFELVRDLDPPTIKPVDTSAS